MKAIDDIAQLKMRLDEVKKQIDEKQKIEWKKFCASVGLQKLYDERDELYVQMERIREIIGRY